MAAGKRHMLVKEISAACESFSQVIILSYRMLNVSFMWLFVLRRCK